MSDLKPELHDFGKIISHEVDDFPKTNQEKIVWHGPAAFSNVDWDALATAEPTNASWLGAVHHHNAEYASLEKSPAPDEDKADIVLLMIADTLAATSSRAVDEETRFNVNENYYVARTLWNPPPTHENPNWTPIKNKLAALELIELVRNDDAKTVLARFGPYLAKIPEDKTPPSVVTSLETHMQLVNQYYAVLKRHTKVLWDGTTPRAIEYNGIGATGRGDAKRNWQFQLVKCQLSFPQTPARVRDLNVFALLEKHTRALLDSDFRCYLLFHTLDTLYFFLPLDESVSVQKILQTYLDDGFYAEIVQTVMPLSELTLAPREFQAKANLRIAQTKRKISVLEQEIRDGSRQLSEHRRHMQTARSFEKERMGKEIHALNQWVQDTNKNLDAARKSLQSWQERAQKSATVIIGEASLYDEPITMRAELDTDNICELCQMRPAEKIWTTPDGLLRENLCEVCYRIREGGGTQGALAEWEQNEPNTQVAWVKLALDYDWAQIHIEILFEEFLEELRARHNLAPAAVADAKASFRPVALLADFTRAYRAFTQRFHALLRAERDRWRGFGERDIVELTRAEREFCIVRLERASDAEHILRAYRTALQECFPRALQESPVRISISLAAIKHPFFDHWRFCKNHDAVINVQMIGRGELHLDIAQYDLLQELPVWKNEVSTFLHRVATIEAKTGSRILPQVELMQDERKLPPEIASALRTGKLNWREVLNYFKLVRRR